MHVDNFDGPDGLVESFVMHGSMDNDRVHMCPVEIGCLLYTTHPNK